MRFVPTISLAIALGFMTASAEPHTIKLLSATVRDQTIGGAKVTIQKNGQSSVVGTTNAQGTVTITTPYTANDGSITMIVEKAGYSTLVAKGPINNMVYALSPVMQELDGLRVVLSWAAEPRDMDSHLAYPDNHVFYQSTEGDGANLDVDETDGYGPETITIHKRKGGEKYVYAVHRYSEEGNFSQSQARVYLYSGSTLLRTYLAPTSGNYELWIPFSINERGEIVDMNRVCPTGEIQAMLAEIGGDRQTAIGQILAGGSFSVPAVSGSDGYYEGDSEYDANYAKRMNRDGETAYHANRLNDAFAAFTEAVQNDPGFAQAWSNLGLTCQKLNKIPEALAANQQAIQRASGSTANTVRASSYYNNARIYEAEGLWQMALSNFQWALGEKQHDAYTKGIARMQAKLK
jgi:hypothetical protein